MKPTFLVILFFSSMLLGFMMCKHDPIEPPANGNDTITPPPPPPSDPCDPDTVYFGSTIQPLLQSSCAMSGCHDAGTQAGRVRLTDYSYIIQTAEVQPFNPGNSKLYEVITDNDPDKRMPPPPAAALSSNQIQQISGWISQGAYNNACEGGPCDSLNVSFATDIWPVIQTYCYGCHSGNNPSYGISLTNHATIATVANGGRLLGSIRHEQGYFAMPKGGNKLSACNIAMIKQWILDGTPDNK
ncbi:MAG: hypothetical protein FJY10_07165 [Bacteroidetes bacterium]|nr:hypothetical protein [Bacteroidota bacterium]